MATKRKIIKLKAGAKSLYTKQLGEKICEIIATSTKGIHDIYKDNPSFPCVNTIYNWLNEHPEFLQLYARAREMQADLLAGQIISIADDNTNDTNIDKDGNEIVNYDNIARSKLRVDSRKFLAAKLKPKVYGDKLDISSGGKPLAAPPPPLVIKVMPKPDEKS